MPSIQSHRIVALLGALCFLTAGCSGNETVARKPSASPSAAPSPAPTYDEKQVDKILLSVDDIDTEWSKIDPLSTTHALGKIRGCSNAAVNFPGSPKILSQSFGSPAYKSTGASYAQLVAVYPGTSEASTAFQEIRENLKKCPEKKKIARKELSDKRFTFEHSDTWQLTEKTIKDWQYLRGFEKAVFPPSLSKINVFYYALDFAQRGNVVFSSIFWQRVTPKKDGVTQAERADEILEQQLEKFG